jgi:hypothetical protein
LIWWLFPGPRKEPEIIPLQCPLRVSAVPMLSSRRISLHHPEGKFQKPDPHTGLTRSFFFTFRAFPDSGSTRGGGAVGRGHLLSVAIWGGGEDR